jgi:hypothetical protein
MMMLAVLTTTASFTSCKSDDDEKTDTALEQNTALKAMTEDYLGTVVFPTYKNLAAESEKLYGLIGALNTKLQAGSTVAQGDIDAICASYKNARMFWEQSEAFLYGAASDFEIDPHIDTWPLDVPTLASDLSDDKKIESLKGATTNGRARDFLTSENLGFHGIEFIFFRNGANRPAAIFNNDAIEDYTYKGDEYFKGMTVTGKEEVVFATAVACDLRDKCWQLEVAWLGNSAPATHVSRVAEMAKIYDDFETTVKKNGLSYGADLLAAGTSQSTQTSWKKVVETILVSGCSNICAEVADQKMGQAYRAAVGKPEQHEDEETGELVEDDPNYIESPYSHNSFKDFYDNIMSIQNSLYGNVEGAAWNDKSVMAYLSKYNAEQASTLSNKLRAALDALNTCRNSGKAFVDDPGAASVKAAMDAITALDDCLNQTASWVLKN